jgi:autotransporter-associated beta strand protein
VILDTNALSALLDKDAALLEVIGQAPELSLPVIVLGEFRFGITVSRRRDKYEAWLARDLSLFRVLPVVEETSIHYAAIRSELKAGGNITSGTGTFSGGITLGKSAYFNADGTSNITFSGAISGTGSSFIKTGTGTITLSGPANTYTGTTDIGVAGGSNAGTLLLGGNNKLPGTAVNIYGGTLDFNSRTDVTGALNLGGGASGSTASVTGTNGTLTLGGNVTFDATNNPPTAPPSAVVQSPSALLGPSQWVIPAQRTLT